MTENGTFFGQKVHSLVVRTPKGKKKNSKIQKKIRHIFASDDKKWDILRTKSAFFGG
jgi:hypothetical protein